MYLRKLKALIFLMMSRKKDTAKKVTVNRPIAYGDTIDKYKAIYNEVKELFDVE